MAHYKTILSQITALISRHVFDDHANIHHSGQKFRSYDRWSQFMAMLIGQLSGRKSLRDIVENLTTTPKRGGIQGDPKRVIYLKPPEYFPALPLENMSFDKVCCLAATQLASVL
jgi:hypothetical protein